MLFGRLHNIEERLVGAAMAQGCQQGLQAHPRQDFPGHRSEDPSSDVGLLLLSPCAPLLCCDSDAAQFSHGMGRAAKSRRREAERHLLTVGELLGAYYCEMIARRRLLRGTQNEYDGVWCAC